MVQGQPILAIGPMTPVFTWLEPNRLWDMAHLRAVDLHGFSPKFGYPNGKTDLMQGEKRWWNGAFHVW